MARRLSYAIALHMINLSHWRFGVEVYAIRTLSERRSALGGSDVFLVKVKVKVNEDLYNSALS